MDQTYGADYASLYQRHWWWRSRERMLVRMIESLALCQPAEILDVGCGNGLFLSALRAFGNVRGIEVDTSLLDEQGPFREQISTDPLGSRKYDNWQFDLITACDVIEHIEQDADAVNHMVSMLKPGGYLLLTVPAFTLLWDHHDEINHHYRRYRRCDVENLLDRNLQSMSCRYIFHSIFLPKLAVKLFNSGRRKKVSQHGLPHPVVNRMMDALCYAEFGLTKAFSPPFGTSILAVAQKVAVTADCAAV